MDSFPPPSPRDRAARFLTSEEAEQFRVGPGPLSTSVSGFQISNTHVRKNTTEGNLAAPPANWPTEGQRIKSKIRGGADAYKKGRGDNPHGNVDLNELRSKLRGMSSMDNDEAPPYGMKRPKL